MKAIILTALLAMFYPGTQNVQDSRKIRQDFIAEIEKEFNAMNCKNTQILSHLIECNTNNFRLQRKDRFIETGRFYDINERALYTMTSTNNDQKNTGDIPYGNCEHRLILSAPDYYDPTAVLQKFDMQCWDPVTKKPIEIDHDVINRYFSIF